MLTRHPRCVPLPATAAQPVFRPLVAQTNHSSWSVIIWNTISHARAVICSLTFLSGAAVRATAIALVPSSTVHCPLALGQFPTSDTSLYGLGPPTLHQAGAPFLLHAPHHTRNSAYGTLWGIVASMERKERLQRAPPVRQRVCALLAPVRSDAGLRHRSTPLGAGRPAPNGKRRLSSRPPRPSL